MIDFIFLILSIIFFALLMYQRYLFVKIHFAEKGIKADIFDYFNPFKSLLIFDENLDFIGNVLMQTPLYFLFLNLDYKTTIAKENNKRRIIVCKLFFLCFGIILVITFVLSILGYIDVADTSPDWS